MSECSVCGEPAVVIVTFTTGGCHNYCRRHAYRRGTLVWKPHLIASATRLHLMDTEKPF